MKVLIACEESQAVCIEFRKLGHEAYSNDLKDCSGGHPEWHLKMDCMEAIDLMDWDFIGMHPTCTAMTLSGNRHYAPGKPKYQERLDAIEWTIGLWNKACEKSDKVYMENPMGAMNGDKRLPKPQIIHPYYFGDEAMKQTCLWLHKLPRLQHFKEIDLFNKSITHVDKGGIYEWVDRKSGKIKRQPLWCAQAFFDKNKDTKTTRSKTFPGIARAMATNWG
jgi:hypothetical protein